MTINLWTILIISLLGCCYGHSVCGPESCNDLSTVKACHNIEQCIQEVWMKQTPTGLTDNVCNICLKMVKEARDQLQSNETMDELRQVLEGSCKLLMLKPAVSMCKKLADEFVPELVAMLSSQMDPEVVCTVAKLCNNQKLRIEQENSRECFQCRNFISAATDFIEKVPKAEFKEEVLHVCRSLGTYSDACFLYAPLLGDYYFNQTTYALAKQPCEVVGVCPKYSKSLVRSSGATSWKEAKTKLCALCPVVAGDVQKQFLRAGSVEDFAERVSGVCEALALSKDRCSDVADYPRLFSYLSQDFDPLRFCSQSFGLCSRRGEAVPVWPLLPAGVNVGAFDGVKKERVKISYGDPIEAPVISFQNTDSCQSCVGMFDSITELAASDKNYLSDILSAVCSNMADPEKCKNFMAVSAPEFFEIFSRNFNSKKICPELVPSCNPLQQTSQTGSSEGACTFCRKVFQSVDEGLKREDARSKVKEYLQTMCESLPSDSRITCETIVNIFVDQTFSEILSKFGENDACDFLKVCGNDKALIDVPEQGGLQKGGCKVCLLIMEELYMELKDKRNEDEVRRALEAVCSQLPAKVRNACDNVVDNYADEIIRLVLADLKPSEVCKKLHFCPAKSALTTTTPAPTLHRVSLSGGSSPIAVRTTSSKIPCNFCLTAIKMILQQLEDEKTEDAIRKALNGLCKYFPEETQDTCRSLIDQYTDDIVDMIVADFNATEVCMYLKICGPKSQQEEAGTFSVATNEVRDNYGPGGACGFCTLLQNSLAVKGNEEKAAESLLAFLVDVCMIGFPHVFQECKQVVSQRILPYGKDGILRMGNVCAESRICPMETATPDKSLLRWMHEAVQECALCETLVEIIANHEKMMAENFDFSTSASLVCTTVPEDMKTKCENVLISYGPSIVNLLSSKIEPQKVCSHLSLCDQNQQAKLHMPVSQVEEDSGECMRGPGFWCANMENAKKCGTLPHCQEVVWKQKTPPQ